MHSCIFAENWQRWRGKTSQIRACTFSWWATERSQLYSYGEIILEWLLLLLVGGLFLVQLRGSERMDKFIFDMDAL